MVWRIEYTRTALSQLRKLDRQDARRILDYMDTRIAVLEDPHTKGKALTGALGGLWRYRVGSYRVICETQDDAMRVLVVRLGNRRDVYR